METKAAEALGADLFVEQRVVVSEKNQEEG